MAGAGTYLVPTLSAGQGVLVRAAAGEPLPGDLVAKTDVLVRGHAAVVRQVHEAGGAIAAGTDAPATPFGRNLWEVELLAAAGLPPSAAGRNVHCREADAPGRRAGGSDAGQAG